MFQAQDVITLITSAIGTSVQTMYTPQSKLEALRYAVDEAVKLEKPEAAYAPDVVLTFTNRRVALPTNYAGWVKMWSVTDPCQEYFRTTINKFDTAQRGFWTIKKDLTEVDGNGNPVEYIYFSDDTPTANFRFVQTLGKLITKLEDYISLPISYKYGLALLAAYRLLSNDRQYSDAGEKYQQGTDLLRRGRADVAKEESHPAEERMESFFDRKNIFDADQQ